MRSGGQRNVMRLSERNWRLVCVFVEKLIGN